MKKTLSLDVDLWNSTTNSKIHFSDSKTFIPNSNTLFPDENTPFPFYQQLLTKFLFPNFDFKNRVSFSTINFMMIVMFSFLLSKLLKCLIKGNIVYSHHEMIIKIK